MLSILVGEVDAACRLTVQGTLVEGHAGVREVHRVRHRSVVELVAHFVLHLAENLVPARSRFLSRSASSDGNRAVGDVLVAIGQPGATSAEVYASLCAILTGRSYCILFSSALSGLGFSSLACLLLSSAGSGVACSSLLSFLVSNCVRPDGVDPAVDGRADPVSSVRV